MRAFHPGTEFAPVPTLMPAVIFNGKLVPSQNRAERIPECFGLPVNDLRKDEPKHKHKKEPEHGADEESKRAYFPKIKKRGRSDRKNIDHHHHYFDLRPADKMIAQGLYYFSFVVCKHFRYHPAKITDRQ